ncbi:hypothetical protein chiPu_0024887 [Chiloscyllium punctatum]|uniref:Uncharacterized protein n=1 Tax=Chiloscyllium punctatum TaxID=137246 RepID=A0A401TDI3_CHIPU|nr:hypothetical protein [Chiloscyllium punctatum]
MGDERRGVVLRCWGWGLRGTTPATIGRQRRQSQNPPSRLGGAAWEGWGQPDVRCSGAYWHDASVHQEAGEADWAERTEGGGGMRRQVPGAAYRQADWPAAPSIGVRADLIGGTSDNAPARGTFQPWKQSQSDSGLTPLEHRPSPEVALRV